MDEILSKNLFLVKEHVGVFKAANNFDIYDPHTEEKILECREEKLGLLTRILRFTDYKRMTPFEIEVRQPNGNVIFTVKRGISLFLSSVEVCDGSGRKIGGFKQKLFSIGGKFDVLDHMDQQVCSLNGKWTGWNFRFEHNGAELGEVDKKWAGVGKELFTSADNYMVSISETLPSDSTVRPLMLAAVLCIDMVLKE
ncbi:MAG: RNAase [bacterium]|nr:RNAase [bacterium]